MPTVIRAIRPPKYKVDSFRLKALSALHEVERGMVADFKSMFETWDHKPVIDHKISTKGGKFSVSVSTKDMVAGMLDRGIPEHDIYPRNPEVPLSFPWEGYDTYIPKTIPDWIGSFQSREEGDIHSFDHVHHPGVQARNFSKIIAKDWKSKLDDLMNKVIRDFAKEKQ